MSKVLIQNTDMVQAGDELELNFSLSGPQWLWLQAAESALLERRLQQKYPNFEIINYHWNDDNTMFTVNVKVIDPQASTGLKREEAGYTVAIVAISAVLIAGFIYLSQDSIYKITQEAGGIIDTAAPAMTLAALAVVLFFVFKIFGTRFAK